MWKTLTKICILLGVAGYLIYSVVAFNKTDESKVCTGLDIIVNDKDSTGFINENEVRELLVNNKLFPEGKAQKDIDLVKMEQVLKASPYIDEALCYKASDGRMTIQVTPRIPVLHVLNQAGEDFYIDNRGGIMPRGHHHINLIVMTGHVNKKTAGPLYSSLGVALNKDTFWNRQIQEIYVTQGGELELTPSVGNHIIQLGDTSHLSDKLSRMKTFYAEGMSKAGWNRYKTINLKFSNQVICTRR